MTDVIVVGGSVVGLATALALADNGHRVQVLERAPADPPSDVPGSASHLRPTVPQALHSHAFASKLCNALAERVPDVYDELLAAGAGEVNLADHHPPALTSFRRQPSDDALRMVLSRRSTFELVLRRRALARPTVSLTPGSTVRGLIVDNENRVRGVRLAGGTSLHADVVVDASGRRSAADSWLAEAELPARRVTSESCKIVYYTRHYRRLTEVPPGPLNRGFGAGGLWDSYTAVLFLGDNDTFSISFGVLPEDTAMKALRDEDSFTAAVQATPLLAKWVEPENSEPISPVYSMGSLDNSLRLPNEVGPAVRGFFALGDAVCTTNPSYGRGVSLGVQHAFLLADLLAERPVTDEQQAREFAERTERLVRPWWEEAVVNDRGRAALWESTLHGTPPPRPPDGTVNFGMAAAAAAADEAVWRRLVNVMMMLAPPSSLYADVEIGERIRAVFASGAPPQLPGASREALLSAVSAASLTAG